MQSSSHWRLSFGFWNFLLRQGRNRRLEFRTVASVLAVLGSLVLTTGRAMAGGVIQGTLPALPLVTHPMKMSGNLQDWSGIPAVHYVPLDASLVHSSVAAVRALQEHPHSVDLKLCYDAKYLYAALNWQDPHPGVNSTPATAPSHWARGGGGVQLNILAGRNPQQVLHVACWPVDGGQSVALTARKGNSGHWFNPTKDGAAAAISIHANHLGYNQMIRIPWSLITANGKAPGSGKLTVLADFAWSDLTTAALQSMPFDYGIAGSRNLTYSLLTAPGQLFSQGYLPNPKDWGKLHFGAHAKAPTTASSAKGISATALTASWAMTPPAMSGNLASWPRRGFANFALEPAFLGKRYSGKIAVQYDHSNLYIAAHITSAVPLFNQMAQATQAGYWGGDALQIRLNNGHKSVNLCGWYDSTGHKPALTADPGDLKNPFLLEQGAKEVFQVDKSGRGYTQFLSIPWKVLFPKTGAPKPGANWRATFQIWWAGLGPRFTVDVPVKLAPPAALAVHYKLPRSGAVTVGVFTRSGQLLRWITRAQYQYAGEQTVPWNGLDQYHHPIPAGNYTLKVLYHPPLTLTYKLTLGNPGTPPWPTANGKGDWLGDESNPQGAATDGKWVFLGSPCSEKGSCIIAVNSHGQRQWGVGGDAAPRCISLAVAGKYLYALYSGPVITDTSRHYNGKNAIGRAMLVCLNKRTGDPARFSISHPNMVIAKWPHHHDLVGLWKLRRNMTFSPENYAGQTRYSSIDVGTTTNAVGLAAIGGKIYVSLMYNNKILILNAKTGKHIGAIPIHDPVGLCAGPHGTLLAISGRRVVQINPRTQKQTVIIHRRRSAAGRVARRLLGRTTVATQPNLLAPRSVTMGPDGDIYVSDWGKSFQVKVFSPTGQFLRAIGKKGGRPWLGKFNPDGMLVPYGIAVTNAHKLWVAEDDGCPRRVSVWNAQTGAFLKQYIGPTPYGGGTTFWASPKNPDIAYCMGTRFKLNYQKKTSTPLATVVRRMYHNEPFAINGDNDIADHRIIYHGGHEYIICNIGTLGTVVVLEKKGNIFVPVAAVGNLDVWICPHGNDIVWWDSDLGYHDIRNYLPDCFKGRQGDNFVWTDKNGDGRVEPNEMQWFKTGGRSSVYAPGKQPEFSIGGGWGEGIAPNGDLYFSAGAQNGEYVFRVPLLKWTKSGAPLYGLKEAKPVVRFNHALSGLYVNDQNRLFLAFNYEWNRGEKNALSCYTTDGRLLWNVAMTPSPTSNRQPDFRANDVNASNTIGEFDFPGAGHLGHVIGTWSWHGSERPYLLTSDGMYIGTPLPDKTMVGPAAVWGESYMYYFQAPDGTPYLVDGGADGDHILQIHGLRQARELSQPLIITSAQAQAAIAAEQAPAKAKPVKSFKPVIRVAWRHHAPATKGTLAGWNMDTGVHLNGGHGRTAQIALARDAKYLYLAYKVHEPTPPLTNKGGDWQDLFITGDCCDLMLGTNPKANPYRQHAALGDIRLLLSEFQGKPIAVLYQPVTTHPKHPVTLLAATIDRITRLTDAKVAFHRYKGYYTLTARVPLADLGLGWNHGKTLRGDVGVIYADQTGRNRILRLYYYNHHTKIISDLTTEATLQPRYWGPVEMPLGPNLLKDGSFEQGGFKANDTHGWCVSVQRNGAVARIVAGVAHSGTHALLLAQTKPVRFTKAAYKLPNYATFLQSANGGHGGGFAQIEQKFPVTSGRRYSLRLYFDATHMRLEHTPPGRPRGYSSLLIWVYWLHGNGQVWVANRQSDTLGWTEMHNARFAYYQLPKPYLAPKGATAARITISLATNAAHDLPRVYVDDVEMVQVPK
jgi:hypothetical protein